MSDSKANRKPKIGEIYMMYFKGDESEQTGWRPGLIFQNDIGNAYSPNVIALPLTSQIKKMNQPTHVLIRAKDAGLKCDSMVLCENPQCVSKKRLGEYVTTLSDEYMSKVAVANVLSSGAIAYIDKDELQVLWEKSNCMNSREKAS